MHVCSKPLRLTRSILVSLSLAMSLTSCVTLPVPPAQYLEDCEVTYLSEQEPDQAAIVRLAVAREYDVKLCNLDKQALRAWYEGYERACGWRCRSVER